MEQETFKQTYVAPALRLAPLSLAATILSNTEPIEGGDDPDLDW